MPPSYLRVPTPWRPKLSGFKKFVRRGITLLPGDAVELGITLEVGQLSEVVTVEAQASLVNTTTGTNRVSIETALLDTMPLRARDVRDAIQLVPTAVRQTSTGRSGVFSVTGLDGHKAAVSIDGTDAQDPWDSHMKEAPPPDAVQEFTVETAFSAEHGRSSSYSVLLTTRSGTNQLHGSAYDYFRSENLNANSFPAQLLQSAEGRSQTSSAGVHRGWTGLPAQAL